jgi:hypothetical protein
VKLHRTTAYLTATALLLAGCTGTVGTSASASDTSDAASASQPTATESYDGGAADLAGTWTRTQDCETMLAAFEEAGLIPSQAIWITGNWVGDPPDVDADLGDLCADARPAEEHSHYFTADGEFGSYDADGEQVDSGDYAVVDADTISFPSHSTEFGYEGDILVDYAVSGDSAEFEVQLPSECDDGCLEAHAWAMSAFFGPEPWTRTE